MKYYFEIELKTPLTFKDLFTKKKDIDAIAQEICRVFETDGVNLINQEEISNPPKRVDGDVLIKF